MGKTKEKNISVDNQDMTEIFLIYGDGRLLCKSEPVAMGHYTALSADIRGKTLTLAIEAGAGGYGWGACAWCEPTLYNDLDSGEVAISSPLNEEERKLVGNGEITICGAART